MANTINQTISINVDAKNMSGAISSTSKLAKEWAELGTNIAFALSGMNSFSADITALSKASPKNLKKIFGTIKTPQDKIYDISNRESVMGGKFATNHKEYQEHIKALQELAKVNTALIETLKASGPKERAEGRRIARENTELGWANLQHRIESDKYYKFEKSFRGGVAASMSKWSSSLLAQGGLVGFMARAGERMARGNPIWGNAAMKLDKKGRPIWNKQTGNFEYNDLPKNNINNWFGGALAKATGGRGINMGALALGGTAAAVTGLVGLGKAIFDFGEKCKVATGQVEMIKTQMSVVMGSDSVASGIYSGIEAYALKSPFGVGQSADMASLLKQSGVNASDLLQTLRMIGDTASGNMEKMKRIANNYAQIQAIGKASMLDMRQFAYAGIPIYKEVAEYMKVSQQELRKMISEGKVSATVIEAVFQKMTTNGGLFENATKRGAETIQARMQNLEDLKMLEEAAYGKLHMLKGGGIAQNVREQWHGYWREHYESEIDKIEVKEVSKWLEKIQMDTANIYEKMPDNGTGNTDSDIRKVLQGVYKADVQEEKRIAGINYKQIEKEIGVSGKSVVGEREYAAATSRIQELQRLLSIARPAAVAANATARARSQMSEAEANKVLKDYEKTFGAKDSSSKVLERIAELSRQLKLLNDTYGDVLTEQKKRDSYEGVKNKYMNGSDGLNQWVLYSNSAWEIAATSAMESIEKKAKEFKYTPMGIDIEHSSLYALSEKYAAEYKNSEEYQEKKKKNDAEEYQKYSDTYDKYSKYIGKNNEILLKNISSIDELTKVLKSGVFTSTGMRNIADMRDTITSTAEERKRHQQNRMAFAENARGVQNIFNASMVGLSEKEIKAVQHSGLDKVFSSMADLAESGKVEKLSTFVQDFMIKADTGAYDNVISRDKLKGLQDILFSELGAMAKAPPATSGGMASIPLWKRIINSSMGINFKMMEGKRPDQVIDLFERYGQKERVGGLMSTMLKNGYSYKNVTALMRYDSKKNKANGKYNNPYQLNWGLTDQEMQRFALSSRADIKVTEGLRDLAKKRLDTYNEFFVQMSMGAENLKELITNNSDFENAFGMLDMEKEGVVYDKDKNEFYQTDANGNKTDIVVAIEDVATKVSRAIENAAEEQKKIYKEAQNNVIAQNFVDLVTSRTYMQALNGFNKYGINKDLFNTGVGLFGQDIGGKNVFEEWFKEYKPNLINKEGSNDYSFRRFDSLLGNTILRNPNAEINEDGLESVPDNKILNIDKFSIKINGQDEIFRKIEKEVFGSEGFVPAQPEYYKGLTVISEKEYNDALTGYKAAKQGLSREDKYNTLKDIQEKIDKSVLPDRDKAVFAKIFQGLDENTPVEKMDKMALGATDFAQAIKEADNSVEKLGETIRNTFTQAPFQALNNTMEKFGENIAKGVEGYEDMDKVIKNIGKSMMSNLSAAATQAGLSLISAHRYAEGFALIAAGGLASFLGGMMGAEQKDDDESDKLQKLKDLKADLADLLKQAREDAIYYENHLRHSNALGYNSQVGTTTKVNDAIITPQGNVITTHPEDYLIASKNPSGLVGKAAGSPIVNIAIENNSGKQISMKQESRENGSGGVDIVAVIEETVGNYVSSSRSDEAFAAREARIKGRTVVA